MSKKHGAKGKRQIPRKHSCIAVPKDEDKIEISAIMRHFDDSLIPKNPSAAIPGIFYHGIITDSNKASLARTIILDPDSGILVTPNYAIYLDSNLISSYKRIEEHTIKELRYNPNLGVLTPTAGDYILLASYLRQGHHIFEKRGKEIFQVSSFEENAIIERSEIELEFENWRRMISPSSVSRLGCIFVASSSENIKRMFDRDHSLAIFEANIIEALNCSRVDSRWFEKYNDTHNNDCIKNYWLGKQFKEEVDTWEYLVDGAIRISNQEAAKRIFESNAKKSPFLNDDTLD